MGTSSVMKNENALGHRLVMNTIVSFVGQVFLLAAVFFSTPYITSRMGPSRYGILVLLLAYIEAFSLLNLGINASVIKYVSEMLPQGRLRDVQAYLGTAFSVFTVAGLLICIAAVLSSRLIVWRFVHADPALQPEVLTGFSIASAAFFVRFIAQALSGIPVAAQRFDITTAVNVGSEILRIAASVAALYLGYLLKTVLLITLLVNLLVLAAYALAAKYIIPEMSFRPSFSRSHFLDMFHFSKFVVISNLSGRVVNSADVAIIGFFQPVSSVAFYGIPYTIGVKLWSLLGNISSIIFPAASALDAIGQREHLRELYLRSIKILAAVGAFPALALCVFAREFLFYWIGTAFSEHGALVLRLLILAFFANALAHIPWTVLQSLGHVSTTARFSVVYAACNVFLFILLIPFWGINGAAAGFLSAQLLTVPWLIDKCNRKLQVTWRVLVARSYAPVLMVSFIGTLIGMAMKPFVFSLVSLALVVTLGLAVHLALTVIFVLDRKERLACWNLLDGKVLSLF